jgi:hypothetical protein
MRFEVAIDAQRRRMRSDLSQQPTRDEKPQIVVDRGQRNGWNATPDRSVNDFWRMMSVRSDDGLIDHLTLVGDRQTVLRGQFTELFVGEAHNYRIRMSINDGQRCPPKSFIHLEKAEQREERRDWLYFSFWEQMLGQLTADREIRRS